jgi:putative membrane-bound dehydrogenase-like protein
MLLSTRINHEGARTRNPKHPILFLLLAALFSNSCSSSKSEVSLAPQKFMATARLSDDLKLELVAAEPNVVDPVAIAFDADGRMYVVEMRDYPVQPRDAAKPLGQVRLLEDLNQDGYYEKATLFADGLQYPTSVLPWRGGVLVTGPPDIVFMKDTNGDGVADVKEVLFSGFPVANTQHNINGLMWGLDNWVYGANGGNNGAAYFTKTPDKKTRLQRMDFRFRPDTGEFRTSYESTGGFGIATDAWGRMFGTHNTNHFQHMVFRAEYLERAPDLVVPSARHQISDHESSAKLFQISEPETRVNHPEQAGRFSAGCGLIYYGGGALSAEYNDSFLVSDVVVNVVHQDVVTSDGPSFRASRRREGTEFLAGTDNWFRPVNLAVGPEGALYVVDMHRAVIEHPEWIPEPVQKRLDLRAGDNKGRIYRIVPRNGLPPVRPQLSSAPVAELVAALERPNKWWRDTAQRLLVERQDKSSISFLERLLGKSESAVARLHALWTLEGLQSLTPAAVIAALNDPSPGVRENALRLAELHQAGSPEVRNALLKLSRDPDVRVRFQLALTLGNVADSRVQAALLDIVHQDVESQWSRYAILSALRDGAANTLNTLMGRQSSFLSETTEGRLAFIRSLASLAAARSDISSTLSLAGNPKMADRWRVSVLDGLADDLNRREVKVTADARMRAGIEKLIRSTSTPVVRAALRAAARLGIHDTAAQEQAIARARARALDESLTVPERLQEVELLELGGYEQVSDALLSLMEPRRPLELQTAAARAMSQFTDLQAGRAVLANWRRYSPPVKSLTLNMLLRRTEFHELLISTLEKGVLSFGELNLDLEQRRRLLRRSTDDIKKRAAALFGDHEFSNRKAIVDSYLQEIGPLRGDAGRGEQHYRSLCAKCHVLHGAGTAVGADLNMAFTKSKEDLLTSILDPNAAIAPEYTNFMVETAKGEHLTGIIKTETPGNITLMRAEGETDTVSRSAIRQMRTDGLSLMPEGLEKGLKYQDLADLLAYLQQRNHQQRNH